MKELKKIYSEKLMLIALVVKAVTGVLGASLILTEQHPYIALICLAIGAGVNEFLLYLEKMKKNV